MYTVLRSQTQEHPLLHIEFKASLDRRPSPKNHFCQLGKGSKDNIYGPCNNNWARIIRAVCTRQEESKKFGRLGRKKGTDMWGMRSLTSKDERTLIK